MESTYRSLANRVQRIWEENRANGHSRVIIAIAGPPGSRKSTIAQEVARTVATLPDGPLITSISADGFHLSLDTLRTFLNSKELIARRGAPWTFDGDAVVKLIRRLQNSPDQIITAPTFDHEKKDPAPDGLMIGPEIQVCLVEGNYLLSNEAPWDAIAGLLVTVDHDIAIRRVANRHLKAGIENTMEKAVERTLNNDMRNGDFVMRTSQGRFDIEVESVEV
ncbi:uncharacterized protein NECHADRAFT_49961 [Fusarium vanettenii 77-13-4]|uniref:Phosphoribulokinase/uridine kinase domain-containing protein n=1 Tax=Fusarium vanettenii (strain ATCC MYA-4622 / CBS 123669 / FGSC 9596 / NRRL 45880 / 77-13-4) TaxID=660122 RepID=C7ZNR2_FUSV7|nr:uncharacterized protein NECHADRAFT_49961 [Fusarium vanettenii 77-13-4]EEU34034.1 hypothetical protein NECHADRAFT_49961 [Fusarium vanettenii 77-13-4]